MMRLRAGYGAAAAAAALSAFSSGLPPVLGAQVVGLTWCVSAGLLVAPRLFAGHSRATRLLATLALSPFVAGAPFAALAWAGVPVALAAKLVCAALAVALLAEGARREREDTVGATAADAVATGIAFAWALLCGVLLTANAYLPLRSDGWFHAAVVAQVAERGVPPEDPYFAGLKLLYFWGSHAWAAAWLALAPRLQPWTPLVWLNVTGAFAVVLGFGALAQRLGARTGAVALACALGVLGYSPFAWGFIVGRAFTGDVKGWADVVHQAGHGIDPVLATMATGQLHGSLAFFGDKYVVLTPFGMGLALLALAVCAALALLERASGRAALALALTVAATLFVHTVVGYALLMFCAAWGALALVQAVTGSRERAAALLPFALAVLAGVLLVAPYLAEITWGKRGQLSSAGFGRKALVSFVLGGLLYVPAGFAWLLSRARRQFAALALLLAAVLVALMGLALKLPENNQSKFLNLLFLLLAPPAALGLEGALRRMTRPLAAAGWALLALATLPSLALAVWGFAGERGIGMHAWRATPAQREACDWLRTHTPADAALGDPVVARDLLVHGGRSVWWGGPYGERDWGYDPAALAARRDLVSSLARGREPAAGGAALLASTRRDVVIVARADAPDSVVDVAAIEARPERFEKLWGNSAMTFYRVRGRS